MRFSVLLLYSLTIIAFAQDFTTVEHDEILIPIPIGEPTPLEVTRPTDPYERTADPYYFIHLADTQIGYEHRTESYNSTHPGVELDSLKYSATIDKINRLYPPPDFVVICGDLVNYYTNTFQQNAFEDITQTLNSNIKLYLVSGNHDVGHPSKTTQIGVDTYRAWIQNQINKPNSVLTTSIESYRSVHENDIYSFVHKNMLGIVLNSSIIFNNGEDDKENKTGEDRSDTYNDYLTQDDWLSLVLTENRYLNPNHTFVFQHHPYFFGDFKEQDDYLNLHYTEREKYLELFNDNNITAIFSGHYHSGKRQALSYKNLKLYIGKAVTEDTPGIRVVKVQSNEIKSKAFTLTRVGESEEFTSDLPDDLDTIIF